MDWYEENIEEGVRDIVRVLRNNGVNTECSCEHEKYIQCQYVIDYSIKKVDNLLFNMGFRDYKITIVVNRVDGHVYPSMNIEFEDLMQGRK